MVSEEEVKKIAVLAKLSPTNEETKKLSQELSSILDYVKQLEKIDTADIDPLSHVHGSTNVMREDLVATSLPSDVIQKIAPSTSGKFIKVPIIIEQE